jgi:hypothetical protein
MVEDLVRRARQRYVLNESLAQLAFAAAVLVAGFVLILILGTRFLAAWSLTAFAAAGIAIGLWRVLRRTPDPYATAVRLDENAKLHDAISTALYFSAHPAGAGEFREAQRIQADTAAGQVHLDQAVPFVFPKSLYAMAALCLLASALIALRYGTSHSLNLRAPLAQLLLEDHNIQDAKKAKSLYPKPKSWMDEAQSLMSKLGMKSDPDNPLPSDPDALNKAIDEALDSQPSPAAQSQKGTGQGGRSGQAKAGDSQNDAQNGDPLDNPDDQANNDQNGQEGNNPQSGQQNAKSQSGKSGQNGKESLLSKLKEAVSNMLSKSDNQNNAGSQQKNQESAKNQTPSGEKGQAGKGAQEQGDSQSDAEGQPDSSEAQNGQQAQGRLNSANQTPQQGGSGIGNQNGSKEIKEAEQLKAMGKISEIIGQRAATVSGETSVEVQSGNQKLRTDYSNASAAHGEAESDITRDEIPLSVQAYVQQYFAAVHKAEGNTKPKQ